MKQVKSATCWTCRRSQEGERNGHWKGGRTKHKAVYVMRLLPGHPRASTAGKYVFEHILVMEEHLGRFLTATESVHHRNGIRDDNRLENLELWVRPHPVGIRVADALAWAREIIERYAQAHT